jgi:MFS superfamily sulfate permease-like transporter
MESANLHYSAGATLFGFFLMMVTIFFVLPMALIVYIVGSLVEWIIRINRTTWVVDEGAGTMFRNSEAWNGQEELAQRKRETNYEPTGESKN